MRARRLPAVVVVLLMMIAACGPKGPSTRETTIQTTFIALNASRDAFMKWDQLHQAAIVQKATTREEGRAKLDEYRAERSKVKDGFEAAYQLLSTAILVNNDHSLATLVQAVLDLKLAIEAVEKIP